jgi:hypothetical protein
MKKKEQKDNDGGNVVSEYGDAGVDDSVVPPVNEPCASTSDFVVGFFQQVWSCFAGGGYSGTLAAHDLEILIDLVETRGILGDQKGDLPSYDCKKTQ